ncbi:MAG TPA: plastocyanin/azurin family copper-binding protein [Gemmatimonadales bacterium]|jgi:plastocyanin|nr:plastocyanin/azurin family copper-binding protein [Gemmatimonadales bacterium]
MPFARLAVAVVMGIAVAAGCSDSTGSSGGGHSTTIAVGNNFFSPTPDTVPAGQVTFSWATPSNGHNVTWLTGPTQPDSSGTKTSGTFQPTLQVGTYTYRCTIHSGMNGTIVVQ